MQTRNKKICIQHKCDEVLKKTRKCDGCDTILELTEESRVKLCEPCRLQKKKKVSKTKYTKRAVELNGYPYHCTLETVAKEFGVTKERVRQIEVKALYKFKRAFIKHYPDLVESYKDN
jgi:hypothetical protein